MTAPRPVILCTATGLDILMPTVSVCPLCRHLTQWFKSFEGRTYCDECVPMTKKEAA